MKLKKIRNLILTFVLCLLGSFIISNNDIKATSFDGYFTSNEFVRYTRPNNSNSIFIFGDTNGSYSVWFFDMNWDYVNMYGSCTYTKYEGAYIGDYVVGTFNCTKLTEYQYNTSNAINHNQNSQFTIKTISNNSNSIESVYNSYIVFTYSSGEQINYYYHRTYDVEDLNSSYDSGYDFGYTAGFDAGLGNRNTLVGMIGAIFTGPVTMLQSVFNFNILGVNFAEMLLGLTTLLVVIWLIKRFI